MTTPAVLHVTSMPGGGVDRHIRDIVRSSPRPHVVWHASDTADVIETFEPRRFHPLHASWSESGGEQLAAWLRSLGVGLVHAHSVGSMPRNRAAWAARTLGTHIVATLHDVLFLREDALDPAAPRTPDGAWLAQTQQFLARASARLAPSDYLARLAREHLPGLSVDVVPNGSPTRAAVPKPAQAREAFLSRRPARVVVVLGAVGPHKGARVLEEAAKLLAPRGIGVVLIGYLDAQAGPGWRNDGLFVHGTYDDDAVAGLVAAYGGEIALFPNQVPESFSYALSDLWDAGVPALVPPEGALGERVARHGGGWLLPAGFGPLEVAAEVERLLSPAQENDLRAVKSSLSMRDAPRVPALSAMAANLEALYQRYSLSTAEPVDPRAAPVQELLATQLDGSLFRPELARVADEAAQLRAAIEQERDAARRHDEEYRRWIAKLEGDVKGLQAELEREVSERRRLGEENARLVDHKAALEQLPTLLRKLLLKKARGDRS